VGELINFQILPRQSKLVFINILWSGKFGITFQSGDIINEMWL
jgi:hypothetical protein